MSLPLDLEELDRERSERGGLAVDQLLLVLDECFELTGDTGVTVALPAPAPWPHLVPAPIEVDRVLVVLSGAPLKAGWRVDWAHVFASLRDVELATPEAEGGSAGWVADACGLSPQLPVGTGEVSWPGALSPLPRSADATVVSRPDTTTGELEQSARVLDEWRTKPQDE
jgi:hypothetical protein